MTDKKIIDGKEVEGIVMDVWGYPVRAIHYYRGVPVFELSNNTYALFEYRELPHAAFKTLSDARRNINNEMRRGYYQ